MTAADINHIKAEYVRGGTSYRKLAEKYGISFNTLKDIAYKDHWTAARRRALEKVTTKMINKAAAQEFKRVDKVSTIADKLLKKIEECVDDGSIFGLSRGIRDITSALKEIREIKGDKFSKDLEEQMARIDKLRKDVETTEKLESANYGVLILPPVITDATETTETNNENIEGEE